MSCDPDLNKLILASRSPRRQEMLRRIGLSFDVKPANLDEKLDAEEDAAEAVTRLAQEKASHVSAEEPQAWVLAADTLVYLQGQEVPASRSLKNGCALGIPADKSQARQILQALSQKTHFVYSGFCLTNQSKQVIERGSCCTEVEFSNLSPELIESYIDSGEPMDKAGAYGLQGQGAVFIAAIRGSHSNVIGLPLLEVSLLLQSYGLWEPNRLKARIANAEFGAGFE